MKKTLFIISIIFIILTMSAVTAEDLNDTVVNATDGTAGDAEYPFYYLQSQIQQSDSTLNLTGNYKYDEAIDQNLVTGVYIDKDYHIVGNNAYIDGNNKARILMIGENCNVVFENITFKNGFVDDDGAGIYLCANSNLKLINCVFENNKAYNSDGAAVNADDGTNVEIRNCKFTSNTCVRDTPLSWSQFKCGMGSGVCIDIGSTLKIYDSVFKANAAHMAIIQVISRDSKNTKTSNLIMQNCLFDSNSVVDCGIIYLDEFGQSQILDSQFKYNKVTGNGGVLEIDTSISTLVKNCQFVENSVSVGGGIHAKVINDNYKSYVNVQGCTFTNNKASVSGGGIYSSGGVVDVSNCNFEKNSAPQRGGAIYSNKGVMKIHNSNFNQNTANDKGGGVCSFNSQLLVEGSTFNKNTASDKGGAIYSNDNSIEVKTSKFNQNTANRGGALYIDTAKVTVLSSSFSANKASDRGGAVYSKIEDLISSGCSYSANTAPTGPIVFGSFHANIQQYVTSPKSVALKIKISSPWKITPSQQIKVTISGAKSFSSKWVKTNSKGEVTITVPYNIKIGKCKIEISIKSGICYVKSWKKVKDTAKLKAPKSAKKSSGLKIKVLSKNTNKPIKNTKFKVKVGGKAMKLKTNSKGVLKIPSNKLSKGTKKITVKLKNADYNINSKCSVKIK